MDSLPLESSLSLFSHLDDGPLRQSSCVSDDQIAAACLEYLSSVFGACPLEFGQSLSVANPCQQPPTLPQIWSDEAGVGSRLAGSGGVMMCLASVLECLAECDELCVFSVRKINKLGFKSYSSLKKYFCQFGTVVAIYFLPYRYKPDTSSVRPSSMAFIRMSNRWSVESIFNLGSVHYVNGWPISVQPFTRGY
jgi:hypothetical protein